MDVSDNKSTYSLNSEISQISNFKEESLSKHSSISILSSPMHSPKDSSITKIDKFLLKALKYNIETDKEEVISTFNCAYIYNKNQKSLIIYIEPDNSYSSFSKDLVLKLFDLIDKLDVKATYMYLNKKHKEYGKFF